MLNDLCHGCDELLAIVDGLELFRNCHFVEPVGRRDENVHLRGLGRDDFSVERLLAEIHLTSVSLGDRDGWDNALGLTLREAIVVC